MARPRFSTCGSSTCVNEKFPVVSFNAWDTDFAGNPFVALSSELLNALECLNGKNNPQLKTLRTRAYQLGDVILAKGVPGAIALRWRRRRC